MPTQTDRGEVPSCKRCDGRSDTCGSDGQREGKEKMKQANSCFHAWLMVVLENPFKFAHESVREEQGCQKISLVKWLFKVLGG